MSQLLFGHNEDKRIVAVHQKDDRTMRIYFRDASGVHAEDQAFFPFFYLSESKYIEGFAKKHWLKHLEGNGYYTHLCAFEEWPVMWDAIRFIIERYNSEALKKIDSYAELDVLHLYPDPVTQYLLQTGRTLFKGMTVDELYRIQLDIETYTTAPFKFSNPNRPGDRIIIIALSDNRGWELLIDGKKLDEKEMLQELVRIITEKDPDVIEGHNIYNFDLPYIIKRCELHTVPFAVGRDGTVPRSFDMRAAYAERAFEYTASDIGGRHVLDTLLLVQSYDMTKRNMESYGLKYAAQYFGVASPDRVYIRGEKISWHWDHDVKSLLAYALDDVRETRALSDQLAGTSFYLTQMLPFNFGHVMRMGSAAKIESLMVREYLRLKQAIPRPQEGTQTSGGYTDIFAVGILGPIMHVDVESLYPSIMLSKHIAPTSDVQGVFHQLLTTLTTRRLEAKKAARQAVDPTERSRLDAFQSSLKILINSFYGYLGYARGLFNDPMKADVVTSTGQEMLRGMMDRIRELGGKVIEVDTDGVFFVPPEDVRTEKDEEGLVAKLSQYLPEGISVVLDGRYRKMLSYKKKNYALLEYDKRIKIKGSSLISRSIERFGRQYVQQCIDFILTNDIAGLHSLYASLRNDIIAHRLNAADFARTEVLKDTIGDYETDVGAGKRNRSAAYEVAKKTGKAYRPGDAVSYYITGNEANPRSFENCKPIEEWDPNFPDENGAYYLRRLDEFSEKFLDFFTPRDFRAIFSQDDLFPFSPDGIAPITREVLAAEDPENQGFSPPEPTIWLDE